MAHTNRARVKSGKSSKQGLRFSSVIITQLNPASVSRNARNLLTRVTTTAAKMTFVRSQTASCSRSTAGRLYHKPATPWRIISGTCISHGLRTTRQAQQRTATARRGTGIWPRTSARLLSRISRPGK
jgi:hypothetical protein